MKVEIKNIKVNQAFSEETLCFIADIYVEGRKIGWAKNDGHGGCTDYGVNDPKNWEFFRKAEAHLQCSDSNMETFIDDVVYEFSNDKEREKAKKKMQRHFEKYVCYGKKGSNEYYTIGFKGSPKFADLVKSEKGKQALTSLVDRIRLTELGEGDEILNTNFAQLGIQL